MENYTLTLTKKEIILLCDALFKAEEKTQSVKHNFETQGKSVFLRCCESEIKIVVEKLNQQEDDFFELQQKIATQTSEQETNN